MSLDPTPRLYHYNARCTANHDGDTVTVDIDLGMNLVQRGVNIRLCGINAPEIRGITKVAGQAATKYLSDLILGKDIVIETIKDKQEKFGRLLARVYVLGTDGCWIDVCAAMVAAGHAVPFMVEK
jgi:micrococcal nuclease